MRIMKLVLPALTPNITPNMAEMLIHKGFTAIYVRC